MRSFLLITKIMSPNVLRPKTLNESFSLQERLFGKGNISRRQDGRGHHSFLGLTGVRADHYLSGLQVHCLQEELSAKLLQGIHFLLDQRQICTCAVKEVSQQQTVVLMFPLEHVTYCTCNSITALFFPMTLHWWCRSQCLQPSWCFDNRIWCAVNHVG